MRLRCVPRLILGSSLGCIRADTVSRPIQLNFLDLPVEMRESIFEFAGLLAYAEAQKAIGHSVPLVTPKVELRLLSGTAEEVKHLDMYDDNQRARLSAIFEAMRAIIGWRSGLPTIIPSSTDLSILEKLAAKFEKTFFEYASLSNSRAWSKYCMAALLGKDTLIKLLPFLSGGFLCNKKRLMLQATAVAEDFDTLYAIANHHKFSSDKLPEYIEDDVFFGGSVEFIRKILDYIPKLVSPYSFEEAIRMGHCSLFKPLYAETLKQLEESEQELCIKWAFRAVARRGWEDVFEQLDQDHPQCLDATQCLEEAAKHGRIPILRYLLFQHATLAKEARSHITLAFEAAVGNGNIDAMGFLLGNDASGNPIIPNLSLTRPSRAILGAVGVSGRWEGIEHLMQLKNSGDVRFENFKLAGDARHAVNNACHYGNLRVLRQLLKKDSQGQFVFTLENPTKLLQDSLVRACDCGHLPIVQELLRYPDVDPAFNANEALIRACENGHHLVIRELLQHGRVDPGARNNRPLIVACNRGHLLVVRELLQQHDGQYIYNVNPAARDNEALIAACKRGHVLVVRELLQHAVEPGARNNAALVTACAYGHLLVVQELLQKDDSGNYVYQGIDPAVGDNRALIVACQNGHLSIVKFLLQGRPNGHGVMEYEHAGISAAVQGGMALLEATLWERHDIIELLLQKTERTIVFPDIMMT